MIHWADLAKVAWVSLAFGVGIAVVFALGVVGAAQADTARAGTGRAGTGRAGTGRAGTGRVRGYVVAGSCFTACAAAALFGIYLIVPQFHR
ncbi:hypothetical protein M6B22_12150 [Jatrophihabitans cynanchi]|jgi:hypothetical protein|uniref:Uncharacterized protein n=1 Tax=Jatrophihabitans cynanchi TaxID=2944128 RepID=A0ABY7JRW4_9ACTN|nr:hypothetical protein [Jatrophihabitans sp. SB3-54]WAX55300.1 hypothetical protein M6B22_12150 [Jatrophihabitans sp. SB3-54]